MLRRAREFLAVVVWWSWLLRSRAATLEPGVPVSPCPGVFRFERRGAAWQGVVTVPAPPTDMPLVLRVELAIAAALTTKYAGTLQLQEGRRALLSRLAAKDRRPVRYTLRFPPDMPLPSVTRIHAMGKVLCRGRDRGAPVPGVTTTISLEHSVRPEPVDEASAPKPPPSVQLFQQSEGSDAAAADDPDEGDQVCGRPAHHRLLVAGGATSSPGDWPWLAAVFASTSLGLEFHCAGSLVSVSHVLTAAHCVDRLKADALLVYLGRHNVRKWTEPQTQAREVAEVHVHPDHQPGNYTADVAVLVLAERVAFDWFVRPVCIDWTGPDALAGVVGRLGTVVGWGTDAMRPALSAEPRTARLPIVSQEACLRSRPEFLHVTSERTFCAGFRNGSGPCNGDSGSGLVLPPDAASGQWFLRGIVSLSLMDGDRRTCDLRHYVVFTDVAKFRDWLAGLIRPSLPPARRPGRPPLAAAKQVEAEPELELKLDDQPIWDSE